MNLIWIVITLQLSTSLAKKKSSRRSNKGGESESAEEYSKLLYTDCKHNTGAQGVGSEKMKGGSSDACPCPKLCCSMCCECTTSDGPTSFVGRQMAPLQLQQTPNGFSMPLPTNRHRDAMQIVPQSLNQPRNVPIQPQIVPHAGKKKKKAPRIDPMLQPPIGSRRDFGFTRENIKNLISSDQDIKKILKDLVRVTMHKVDLVEKVKTRRNMNVPTPTPSEDMEYIQ